jgi:hypothetical protein
VDAAREAFELHASDVPKLWFPYQRLVHALQGLVLDGRLPALSGYSNMLAAVNADASESVSRSGTTLPATLQTVSPTG